MAPPASRHAASRHAAVDSGKGPPGALKRVLGALLAFVVLVAGAVAILSRLDSADSADPQARPTCAAHTVRLTVDPAIEDAVLEATADLSDLAGAQGCLAVDVDARPSAEVAAELSRPAGVGLATSLPDAWLPDSSIWLRVARRTDAGAARLVRTPDSVATSPIVLAVRRAQAEASGWPGAQLTWADLVSSPIDQWRLGVPDPQVATSGLAALLAVDADSAGYATLGRRLELPATGERSPAGVVGAGDVDAMPTAEYDVARTAAAGGDVVASYDPALGGGLDFPLIGITPDGEPVSAQVAADLELLTTALLSPSAQSRFREAGLRDVAGALAEPYAEGSTSGVLADQVTAPLDVGSAKVAETLKTWSSVGRRARLLVLLDLSGSMAETLPGGEVAKIDLARESLRELIAASAPDSDLGLWTFTTGAASDGTDRVVEIGPLGEQGADGDSRRDTLEVVVGGLSPVPDGGTPLYRALLSAYSAALSDYAFGRYNAVVVVTDGRDADDTQGPLAEEEVIDRLRQQYDGMRPVEIIALAYGEEVDFDVLRQFADVTGGAAYQGLTQDEVGTMLREALSNT